jgi:hypothetical protein
MTHLIEPASSGRAKCRGCKQVIAKGELRFGEQLPNPFTDGDMTLWFHIPCAAYRRPASLQTVIDQVPERSWIEPLTRQGITHERLERICGIERAPSGRARCRHCSESIGKQDWRIKLEFFEEGMFNPSGNVHLTCACDYFGTDDLVDRLHHFSTDLTEIDESDIRQVIAG